MQALKSASVVAVQSVMVHLLLEVRTTTTMIPLGEVSLRMSHPVLHDHQLMLRLIHCRLRQRCPVFLPRVVASWSLLGRT